MVLLSTQNICFGWEIRKNDFLLLNRPVTLYILMDFHILIDTVRMGLSIIYCKGSTVRISNYDVFLFILLKVFLTFTNCIYPDEMPHSAGSSLFAKAYFFSTL